MVGIVILNYNGWDMTVDCIKSIRKSCNMTYKVYIVDNASTVQRTEVFDRFIECSNDCKVIVNATNKGYSAGNNSGIKQAIEDCCDYIMITNNDVLFKQHSIEKLCDFLYRNSLYGIAGPKVFLPNGNIQEINMGCKMTMSGKYKYIFRKTPLKLLTQKYVEEFHASKQDLKTPFEVYAVSGCCFVMSRKAATGLYPLDENTFLYEEENIIGARMEALGLKTIYCTDSEIIHLGGASTSGMSDFAYSCFVESEIYYCKKYLKQNTICVLPLVLIRTVIYVKLYGFHNFRRYKNKIKAAFKRGNN